MASRKSKPIAPPPGPDAPDAVKARYYETYDPVELLRAGYLEEDGIFEGDKRVVDLRPGRGLVSVPIRAKTARRLHRAARRAGCTPSELATRLLERDLGRKTGG